MSPRGCLHASEESEYVSISNACRLDGSEALHSPAVADDPYKTLYGGPGERGERKVVSSVPAWTIWGRVLKKDRSRRLGAFNCAEVSEIYQHRVKARARA